MSAESITQASISKSVGRAFRVLELFQERQKPMTAAEIQHALAVPQPSARVLLKELVAIGYLGYSAESRTYFPAPRLAGLGGWLATALVPQEALVKAVGEIAQECEETASLCTSINGCVEVVHVRRAEHALALQLEPGSGATLWRTAVGQTLLSMEPEEDVLRYFASLSERDAPPSRRRRDEIIAGLARIRRRGFFVSYDLFLQGVGAVCVPAPRSIDAAPLVIAVAGGKDRIQMHEKQILRVIRRQLRLANSIRRPPAIQG